MGGKLDREGFVINWLISGPKVGEFVIDNPFDDQLRFEKHMRSVLRDGKTPPLPKDVVPGSQSALGMPWRYSGGGSRYVDVSFFYHLPARVELYGYTELTAGEERNVAADLWTYAALDVWVDGSLVCTVERPVYKPITRKQLSLPLKKGKNTVFIRLQNLGVRDTRSIFALQLREPGDISVTLPGEGENLINLDNYLKSIRLEANVLALPPGGSGKISAGGGLGDLQPGSRISLDDGITAVKLRGESGGFDLERTIEVIGNMRPVYGAPGRSEEDRRRELIGKIAANTEKGNRFKILNVLARYALGKPLPEDRDNIIDSLKSIEDRIDCSDFIAAGIIRLMKLYKLDADLLEKAKETFKVYRFWMDENGSDGMCFWSENHALLFHSAQLLACAMYPGEHFTRSGRAGKEQAEIGARRCREWLEDVKEDYFEEFLSSGYMCITIGALLNVVDFGPEDLSAMAAGVMDQLLEQLCRHACKGTLIGPQGRVYRDVIYPFLQGTQAMLHYIDTDSPYSDNAWPVFLATTKYKIPGHLKALIHSEINERYSCGNGEIVLYKRKNYTLSSLASPKLDMGIKWKNIINDPGAVRDSYRYTKSLNEKFHGTTDFRPGIFGYQQHFWYAALDNECITFSNLPGGDVDSSSMRPGYWYGNGIFPALKQDRNMLGVIYAIPESYPIHFTHLFFPSIKYDEVRHEEGWIFGRKKDAWLGIWCSSRLEWHDDMLSGCELRSYADKCAYVCICSDLTEDGSFEAFTGSCKKKAVSFDEDKMFLTVDKSFSLRYAVHADQTQYI